MIHYHLLEIQTVNINSTVSNGNYLGRDSYPLRKKDREIKITLYLGKVNLPLTLKMDHVNYASWQLYLSIFDQLSDVYLVIQYLSDEHLVYL